MNLNSQSDAIGAISERLRTIYKPYEGAHFRCAFYYDGTTKHFLTAYVLFRDQHVASRPQAEYRQRDGRKFIFVEYWCRGQWEAVKLLSKLLSGEAEIEGHRIEAIFSRSELEHDTYPRGRELWTGHRMRSRRDTWKEFHIPQGYLFQRGSSPYYGPDHAINDWIFNMDTWNTVGADVSDKNNVITWLPDSRARIASADWQRPQLHLEVDLKIPSEQAELQILYAESKSHSQSVPLKSGAITVEIPEDVRSFTIFLLDDSGDCISHVELDEHRTKFGKADPDAGRLMHGNTPVNGVDVSFVDLPDVGLEGTGDFLQIGATNTNERQFMEMAIAEARKSQSEDGRSHPKVGAVVVKNGRVLAKAHRGEFLGCHAEYAALEKKLANQSLAGATVYTTLEPCTTRNHPKVPCASRLIERKVARVVIGMLDPNPNICGRGQRALRKARIATDLFHHDLMEEIEELNREFMRHQESEGQTILPAVKKSEAPPLTMRRQHTKTAELPTMVPKIRPVSYGRQSDKNFGAGLIVANDGEPAYDIVIPDIVLGGFRIQITPHFTRLSKEDGTKFCEVFITNSNATLLPGEQLLEVMRLENVGEIAFPIRFRNSDGDWYVATCKLEFDVAVTAGGGRAGIVARFVKQELESVNPTVY